MKLFFHITFILFLILIIFSCKKPKKYPETPAIEFEKFEIIDSIDLFDERQYFGILTFAFIDGDGDIGLNESDTLSPYHSSQETHFNLFMELFHYRNNSFQKVELEYPYNYRINPRIDNSGQNKTLKGRILVKLDLTRDFLLTYDTIKFDLYILDRALHQSNTIETDTIYLPAPL